MGMDAVRAASTASAVCGVLLSANALAVNDLGQAVQNIGGNQLEINAANAIFTTCIGFAGPDAPDADPNIPGQVELSQRCVDMTQTGFALANFPNPPVPADDTFGLTGNNQGYLNLLRQFTGEEVSTQGRYATEGVGSQFKSLAGRLGAIRRGARRSGLAFNMNGVDVMTVADDGNPNSLSDVYGGAAGEGDGDSGWAWFANFEYGFGERDDTGFEDGYDADSFGVVLGVDYAVSDSLVVGAALTITEADIEFDNSASGGVESVSGGDLDADSEQLSFFANWAGPSLYASAIVSFAQAEYDMVRNANVSLPTTGGLDGIPLAPVFGINESSTDSDQFSAQVQFGNTFGEGATTFDLYGGLEYSDIEIDRFSESGSLLALSFGDQDIDSLQGIVGAAVRRAISTDSGVLVPYASVEYRHEFDNDDRIVNARYVLSTSGSFILQGESDDFEIPTDDSDDSYFDITVGISAQFANNVSMFAQFSTLAGLEDIESNVVTVGIRGSF